MCVFFPPLIYYDMNTILISEINLKLTPPVAFGSILTGVKSKMGFNVIQMRHIDHTFQKKKKRSVIVS